MFAPPKIIETTVFATLPDKFRVRGRTNKWIDIQRAGALTDSFLEGPSFDRDGYLYVTDVPWGRIFRISPAAKVELFAEYDGEPNGLRIHRDGRFFIADFKNGIMVLDPKTRAVTPYLTRAALDRFKGVNDLVFASNGDLYFTDQGLTGQHDPSGRLYRLRANGQLDCLLDNIPSPNSLVLGPSEDVVYVNVTRGNCVWRVPMMADGTPFKVGVFIQLSGGIGPDGLVMDEAGNLAVTHLGLGCVWLFNRLGEPIGRIQSCTGLGTTNAAYGVTDRTSLYITEAESGTILKAELDTPGRRIYSHL
jgi:gluconolactonase